MGHPYLDSQQITTTVKEQDSLEQSHRLLGVVAFQIMLPKNPIGLKGWLDPSRAHPLYPSFEQSNFLPFILTRWNSLKSY